MNDINEKFDLKIYKSKNVKTPTKAWAAAGWDFYIPENLSIFDFTENYKMYLDDHVKFDKNYPYNIPLVFHMKSKRTVGEFLVQLVLTWSNETNHWKFNICDYEKKDTVGIVSLADVDDKIIKWLTEDETVISKIELLPHASINIPSGIHVNLPENVFMQAANKSGIGSKRRLSFLAEIIDQDYVGEIHINLINESDLTVVIEAGEKIVQMIPMFQPVMNEVVEFNTLDDLCKGKKTERGAGGFGSSGEK